MDTMRRNQELLRYAQSKSQQLVACQHSRAALCGLLTLVDLI